MTVTVRHPEDHALAQIRGLLAGVLGADRLHPEQVLDVVAAFNELDVDGALPGLLRSVEPPEPFAALTLARDLCRDQLETLPPSACLSVGRAIGHLDRALEALDA
jgi:hypothetical protein